MNNDLLDEVLLLLENKVYIHFTNNILHIDFFEESLTLDDTNKMINILDNFYENCKKKNLFFYILYDFTQLSITSSSNLIYNTSIHHSHLNKHIQLFRSNLKKICIIIKNYTIRASLNTILDLYKPEIKPSIIEDIQEISTYFL